MNLYPIFESPQKKANEDRYGIDENSCVCCGKRLKEIKLMIHAVTTWEATDARTEEECAAAGYESQGCFPIGADCAKHFPKEFIF